MYNVLTISDEHLQGQISFNHLVWDPRLYYPLPSSSFFQFSLKINLDFIVHHKILNKIIGFWAWWFFALDIDVLSYRFRKILLAIFRSATITYTHARLVCINSFRCAVYSNDENVSFTPVLAVLRNFEINSESLKLKLLELLFFEISYVVYYSYGLV